jgi:hypothetical protein
MQFLQLTGASISEKTQKTSVQGTHRRTLDYLYDIHHILTHVSFIALAN